MKTWVLVEDVCAEYGLKYGTALKNIANGTFPVQTFKVGRKSAIDKLVHQEYFAEKQRAGLSAIESTKS